MLGRSSASTAEFKVGKAGACPGSLVSDCAQEPRTSWRNAGLSKPRISHPWPSQRFRVKHPRWEPYAGIPHVRFCAGGAR
jgi:hypothetical protein